MPGRRALDGGPQMAGHERRALDGTVYFLKNLQQKKMTKKFQNLFAKNSLICGEKKLSPRSRQEGGPTRACRRAGPGQATRAQKQKEKKPSHFMKILIITTQIKKNASFFIPSCNPFSFIEILKFCDRLKDLLNSFRLSATPSL